MKNTILTTGTSSGIGRAAARLFSKNGWNVIATKRDPAADTRTDEAFARMSAARMINSDDVARVIHDAATDGTDRLRYLVGDDARGFIKTRQEMSERDYVAFMRAQFAPRP